MASLTMLPAGTTETPKHAETCRNMFRYVSPPAHTLSGRGKRTPKHRNMPKHPPTPRRGVGCFGFGFGFTPAHDVRPKSCNTQPFPALLRTTDELPQRLFNAQRKKRQGGDG